MKQLIYLFNSIQIILLRTQCSENMSIMQILDYVCDLIIVVRCLNVSEGLRKAEMAQKIGVVVVVGTGHVILVGTGHIGAR